MRECIESENHAFFDLEIPLDETKHNSVGKQEIHKCVEMNNGNQKRHLETDFQKELREIMEAEEVSHTQMVIN